MRRSQTVNLCHQVVRFSPTDIYFPDLANVLLPLYREKEIEGEVIGMSDSGAQKDAFAIIKVDRVSQHVFVPVQRVTIVHAGTSSTNKEEP
jgi:hypothetical protein